MKLRALARSWAGAARGWRRSQGVIGDRASACESNGRPNSAAPPAFSHERSRPAKTGPATPQTHHRAPLSSSKPLLLLLSTPAGSKPGAALRRAWAALQACTAAPGPPRMAGNAQRLGDAVCMVSCRVHGCLQAARGLARPLQRTPSALRVHATSRARAPSPRPPSPLPPPPLGAPLLTRAPAAAAAAGCCCCSSRRRASACSRS